MSSLSQFAPFAGGGIKSIQQGLTNTSIAGAGGYISTNFTISSVNTAKAIPEFQGNLQGGNLGLDPNQAGSRSNAACVLTSSTNLQVGNYVRYSGWYLYGRWYVVESN